MLSLLRPTWIISSYNLKEGWADYLGYHHTAIPLSPHYPDYHHTAIPSLPRLPSRSYSAIPSLPWLPSRSYSAIPSLPQLPPHGYSAILSLPRLPPRSYSAIPSLRRLPSHGYPLTTPTTITQLFPHYPDYHHAAIPLSRHYPSRRPRNLGIGNWAARW